MMRRESIVLALIFACLFHVAIAANRHLLAEEHDHGDLDHDHMEEDGYEWIGKTSLQTGTYTMVLSKVDGTYIDETMAVLFLKVDDDWEDQMDTLKQQATEIMAHAAKADCSYAGHDHDGHEDDLEEDNVDHDDAKVHVEDYDHENAVNQGDVDGDQDDANELNNDPEEDELGEDEHDHKDEDEHEEHEEAVTCTTQGEQVVLDGRTFFVVQLDPDASSTLIKLSVPAAARRAEVEATSYLIFASHAPFELEDELEWLVSASGTAVEIEDVEGGLECKSGLTTGQVWGYSIAGSLLTAICSLVGILLLVPLLSDGVRAVLPYLHSLAAGVLLSMVLVHLIPESLTLAGPGNAWKASTCVLGGFAAALLLEHLINIRRPRLASAHHDTYSDSMGAGKPCTLSLHQVSVHEMEPATESITLARTDGVPPPLPSHSQPHAQLSSAQPIMLPEFYPHTTSGYGQPYLAVHRCGMVVGQAFGSEPVADTGQILPVVGSALRSEKPPEPQKDVEAGNKGGSGSDLVKPEGSLQRELEAGNMAMVLNIVLGDFCHNFFDGVAIAIAFKVCGTELGWTVTASAVVHELPQEISDFVLLTKAGLPAWKALCFNWLSSLSSVLGAIIVIPLSQGADLDLSMGLLLGIGAGFLLYIAIDLIPGIVAINNIRQARWCWLSFSIGAVAMGLMLLNHVHCHCEAGAHSGDDAHAGHSH